MSSSFSPISADLTSSAVHPPVLQFVFAPPNVHSCAMVSMLAGMAITFAGSRRSRCRRRLGVAATAPAADRDRLLAGSHCLILPRLAERAMRPLVGLGERCPQAAPKTASAARYCSASQPALWAPCAGTIWDHPHGAALSGASAATAGCLAYALGAATSLAGALLVGGKLFAAMKRSIGAGEGGARRSACHPRRVPPSRSPRHPRPRQALAGPDVRL